MKIATFNINSIRIDEQQDRTTVVSVTLETTGVEQLSRIFAKIEGVQGVFSVTRETDSLAREIA